MYKLSNKDASELAMAKLSSDVRFRFEGAKAIVEKEGGRFLAIPPKKEAAAKSLKECEQGAILGKLSVDYARPGIISGIFDVKILKDHGTWVVQLLDNNQVVGYTTAVSVEELPERKYEANPEVFLSANSPCFLVYVAVGFLVIAVLSGGFGACDK
jgi:hypothetical protein